MPRIKEVKTFKDERGALSVVESTPDLGFTVKRVFYIYDAHKTRGGHGHLKTEIAMIAVRGTVLVKGQTPREDFEFRLQSPTQCLILDPEDWHTMDFEDEAILLVLASDEYHAEDYFFEPYRK